MNLDREVEERLERGKRKIAAAFGADPNVTGVGISFRRRGGQWTDEPAVVVMVAKKRPEAFVSRRRLLPRTVDVDGKACGVDVVQAGPFTTGDVKSLATPGATLRDVELAAADYPIITERMRPPRQGCSISNIWDGATAGTLGMFVIDKTDRTVCLLSNNHVIARMSRGTPGDAIIQPGGYDGGGLSDKIATLKRWVPTPETGTNVDAAIAQLDDQSAYTMEVARDLMAPISTVHPTVGIVTAGDALGSTLLTRMDATIAALGVELPVEPPSSAVPATSSGVGPVPGVSAPFPLQNIEKVGRTTGYTSSMINAIHVDAPVLTPIGWILYTDLFETSYFSLAGDSGSVAFVGGDGMARVPPAVFAALCSLLGAVGDYYQLPLTEDSELADQLRDDFLAQSLTGNLMIRLTYVNSQTVIDRLEDLQATPNEVAYAQLYYDKYHDFVASVLANPSSTEVVTQEHLDDAAFINNGLSQTVLTPAEAGASWILYDEVFTPTLGMNRRQILDYMNDPTVYQKVYDEVKKVPTVELRGPIELDGPTSPD